MCTAATYHPRRLHAGHLRMLRVAAAVRAAGKSLTRDGRQAEWESVDAVKTATERPIARLWSAVFADQEREVLAALPGVMDRLGIAKAPKPLTGSVLAQLLDPATWAEVVEDRLRPLIMQVLESGFRTGALRVSYEPEGYEPTTESEAVMREVLGKVLDIHGTTQDEVAGIIERGMRDRLTRDEIALRIRERFGSWKLSRAITIAQTAATPAFEVAQQQAFTEAGVETNEWLSQRDGRVRPSHLEADAQQRPVGTPFSVGGAALRHPGDPAGPATEVIRCRCTLIPIITAEAGSGAGPAAGPAARSWRDERDDAIRKAYPALRNRWGYVQAMEELAEQHCVSRRTVERAVYGQ